MITERGLMSRNSGCRARTASVVIFSAAFVLTACSSSEGARSDLVSGNATQTSALVDTIEPDSDTNSLQLVVRVASGYLRDLMDSTFGNDAVDYHPFEGAKEAISASEVAVTGYLIEIVAGVTEVETNVRGPLTEAEQRVMLDHLDERERFFVAEGWTGPEWQELEEERRLVIENNPLPVYELNYAAYRVGVTEVIKGDIEVGDVLDVQVYAGVDIASEWVDPVLSGTPRVVVAGSWGKPVSGYELRDATGMPIEDAFWPQIEIFWLDEGVWEIDGGDVSGVGSAGVVQESLVEHSTPIPEAHHLTSLQGLHDAWGNLESLDDLAHALRTAAAELSGTSTTTSTLE